MADILSAASGRWPELLQSLAGLSAEQLTDKHQPCPACGGTDRYRWDKDDSEGGWFCNRCGGKDHQGGGGNGMDLLMRVTGLGFTDALRRVERHLGIDAPRPAPPTSGAEAFWWYSPDFLVVRFATPPKAGSSKPGKSIRPLLWSGSEWQWKQAPAPRPLYWARRQPGPVIIVEGEKTADAAARLFPAHAVATWAGGCKALGKANWAELKGRTVTLWPDNDEPGRDAMRKLAARLVAQGCSVAIADYPADSRPEGWDLADGGLTPENAAAAMERVLRPVADRTPQKPELPAKPPAEPPGRSAEVTAALNGPAPFTCLGFDDGGYYYQPNETGQVIRIGGASHNATNILRLAGIGYWENACPGSRGVNWQAAASRLFRDQAAVGVYSPDRIRGRGAWWDKGRSVLHLGDRLIVDGITHPITKPPPSTFSYQRLASIEIPDGLQPLGDMEGMELLDIANRFLWEVPASGLLMAGWVALAPICGSLGWRPHIWLTAAAGSGKSALLDRYIGPLIDAMALWPEGNTTEAFIRQELKSDARAVVMDEAESNEPKDRARIQEILALARVASSSGRGVIGKGGADGLAQRFVVRSMFMLCSISTALKQGADQSRFAQLTMRHPDTLPKPERTAHWRALDRDLARFVTEEVGHRLLLRSVRLIPVIRESAAVFRRAAADRFDSQRQGDQYGTLLAGAWSLYSVEVPTEAQALQLIDDNDWTPYREAAELPDELRCIQAILQHQIRVEGDRGAIYQRTISELVDLANPAALVVSPEITATAAVAHLGRIGLKVDKGCVIVHNNAAGLRKILSDTAWSHCWPTVIGRLRGAQKLSPTRFQGLASTARAVSIPLELLQA